MKCQICKQGDTRPDTTTVTLEADGATMVFKNVPADVCEICGEAYVDEKTTAQLLDRISDAREAGVEVDVRDWSRARRAR